VSLAMIKKKKKIMLWIQNLQTIHAIFQLDGHIV